MSYFHKKGKPPPSHSLTNTWDRGLGLPRYYGVRRNAHLSTKQLQSRWSEYDLYCNLNCTKRYF